MKKNVMISIDETVHAAAKVQGIAVSHVCEQALRVAVTKGAGGTYIYDTHTHTRTPDEETASNQKSQSPTVRNAHKIIQHLYMLGMDSTGTISRAALEKVVAEVIGGDPRTVRRYAEFIVAQKYLVTAGPGILKLGERWHGTGMTDP